MNERYTTLNPRKPYSPEERAVLRCVPTTDVLLDCKGLRKTFGKLEVLKGVSFSVGHHEIFGIAGPNGAGKSVLFNVITKIPYPPDEGEVRLGQVVLTGLGAPRIAQLTRR